jgi:trehalose 6-phosphate phosphatase
MPLRSAPAPERNLALFLDVDGTLLEIAATPLDVKVSPALRKTLMTASARAEGALALISGRSIQELDALFAPCVFPASGQHGLERRDRFGNFTRPNIDSRLLGPARSALTRLQARQSGLLLEDKGTALAMHFRLAPRFELLVRDIMDDLVEPLLDRYELREGKCVLEITPRGYSKRIAIEAFMSEQPFASRRPVFIGDDATDEDGFEAVNALNGYSIHVGDVPETLARYCFEDVAAVLAWLRECNIEYDSSELHQH